MLSGGLGSVLGALDLLLGPLGWSWGDLECPRVGLGCPLAWSGQ